MRTIPAFGEPHINDAVSTSSPLKVLYMSHLALGDYIYQGPFLKALTDTYSNIKLDIWIDDCRKKKKAWHAGRSQALVQWLSSESHINYIYPITSHHQGLDEQIKKAHLEDYDAIIYVATNRSAEFAKTAIKIVDQGKVFGTIPHNNLDKLKNYSVYKKLDGKIHLKKVTTFNHISDFYQDIFQQFFSINISPNQRLLKLNISQKFKKHSLALLESWGAKNYLINPKVIFINHLSTCKKRDWKLSQLEELLLLLGDSFSECLFILNSSPNDFEPLNYWAKNNPTIKHLAIETFTATSNFLELPSLMSLCDLVISVETSIMHLASSLNIKQIALIRQSATQWRPLNNSLVIQGKQRVDSIKPHDVFNAAISLQ